MKDIGTTEVISQERANNAAKYRKRFVIGNLQIFEFLLFILSLPDKMKAYREDCS
jgi:hypothetical protein